MSDTVEATGPDRSEPAVPQYPPQVQSTADQKPQPYPGHTVKQESPQQVVLGDAPAIAHDQPASRNIPQLGPLRENMLRTSTPPEGTAAIRYTKSGRVSKATKGQRIHSCEECGKTYTRAEHLRRHQQNHKPGAFPCELPGCGRSFYREDLLLRHRARHNDPKNQPSRRNSIGCQGSPQNSDRGAPVPNPPSQPQQPQLQQSQSLTAALDPIITEGIRTNVSAIEEQTSAGDGSQKAVVSSNELQQSATTISNNANAAFYGGPGTLYEEYNWNRNTPSSAADFGNPTFENPLFSVGPCYYQPSQEGSMLPGGGLYPTQPRSAIPVSSSSVPLPYLAAHGV